MPIFIKNAAGEFIEVNPNNFNTCNFRSDPVLTAVESSCCKNEIKIHYRCRKLDINGLSYENCQSCGSYEKKVS